MSETEAPEPTVRLDQMPGREDFMAALQAATWACECPPLTSRLFALTLAPYAARRCCKGCQARRALSELAAVSERL
jgi:hypothetical protein